MRAAPRVNEEDSERGEVDAARATTTPTLRQGDHPGADVRGLDPVKP